MNKEREREKQERDREKAEILLVVATREPCHSMSHSPGRGAVFTRKYPPPRHPLRIKKASIPGGLRVPHHLKIHSTTCLLVMGVVFIGEHLVNKRKKEKRKREKEKREE